MIDRRLQYVLAIARYGSFTAAAEQVGVTQSAITKSVAELERQVGFQIFARTRRGAVLTEQGRAFEERAGRVVDMTQDLLRGVTTNADPFAGLLRIGVCPTSIEWLLMQPTAVLLARHPSIRLEIVGASQERIVQQLRSETIDVALGYEAGFQEQPDFRRERLSTMPTTLFVRRGHPILEIARVTEADLAKYDMVSPADSRPYDSWLRQIYEEAGIDPKTKQHFVDFFPLAAKIVEKTDAVGFVSLHYTETPAFKSRFECVPFLEFRGPRSPLCCATRLRSSPRPAVRAFIKVCREHLPTAAPLGGWSEAVANSIRGPASPNDWAAGESARSPVS
jgi:DNA-binding transcriptional LysR family regulator